MKIAVVGCGAVGSFYGTCLHRAGEEVHFLLRSDYEAVRQKGLLIRSPGGDFHFRPICAKSSDEIGPCDLVLVGLKTTANSEFRKLLPPLVGPATAILTLQNGLGNEEELATVFAPEQILGGLCFVCLNRLEPGLIHHIAHGKVVLGEFGRQAQPRTHQIDRKFRDGGVPCAVTDDLARAHWEKLVWNIPFNGLGVAASTGYEGLTAPSIPHSALRNPQLAGSCVPTDRLLDGARWENLVRELMLEVIATARALGHNIPESLADKQIVRTRDMGPYKASTLIDFERGLPLELESLFLAPLRYAHTVGIPTPRLERLCAVLQSLA